MLRDIRPHGERHLPWGSDPIRLAIQAAGTLLHRFSILNFSTGLTAKVNTANKRIDVTLADHNHAGDVGDGGQLSVASLSDYIDWTDWTPTVIQDNSVTIAIQEAKYFLMGKICYIYADLSVNGTGDAGSPIVIGGMPAAAQPVYINYIPYGHVFFWDTSSGIQYVGQLMPYADATAWRIMINQAGHLGVNPNIELSNGDNIRFAATYHVA